MDRERERKRERHYGNDNKNKINKVTDRKFADTQLTQ